MLTIYPPYHYFPGGYLLYRTGQDAAAWAASLQQAQLAAETGDFDEIRRRLRSAGRLNRTECEALNPLAPPFKVGVAGWGGSSHLVSYNMLQP